MFTACALGVGAGVGYSIGHQNSTTTVTANPFGAVAGQPDAIGQTVSASTPSPAAPQAQLGSPISKGALTVTVTGPVTTEKSDTATYATFHVTLTNTASSGDVIGPDSFGIRCDANRDDRNPGDEMSTTTIAQDKHIAAGKTMSGVAVVAWLTWDKSVKCTGPTTIEARFLSGGFLSWTLPADVVAKVNAVGGAS